MLIAIVCLGVALGGPRPGVGLLAALAVPVPYLIVSGVTPDRLGDLGLPRAWAGWLSETVAKEVQELERRSIHRGRKLATCSSPSSQRLRWSARAS